MKRLTLFFVCFLLLFCGAAHAQTVTAALDASQKGADISPYIYGQFIEHMGRCIYGGIWAEVLQDRKFYEPLDEEFPRTGTTKSNSPWCILASQAGIPKVSMSKDAPFTGKWSPELQIQQFACIYQADIHLRRGVDYVGYIWLKSSGFGFPPGEKPGCVSVSLAGCKVPIQFTPSGDFVKCEFRFPFLYRGLPEDDSFRFEITFWGYGTVQIGCVSLMPADNIQGMRPDTLAALKELNSPVYRWPGGNFVSGYDWRDGIGDRDRRPPRKNPAWKGVEPNDFGLDEFMTFCRFLETEPYIAVNTGDGQVENAVAELEYANCPADSEMGKLRTKNGHAEPYRVRFWGIGNEMYGNWQIGHMPVADYVKKHNAFYGRFKAADPNIFCIGVGAVGDWNEAFIPDAFDHLDALSEHIYDQNRENAAEHIHLAANSIESRAKAHEEYRTRWSELYAKKNLPIVMDEWNYAYGPHVFGEGGTRFFQMDGLGIAAGLHAFFRHSDLFFMANYAQTVNVLGAVKTTPTSVQLESTGLVLKLYREHFGTTPIFTQVVSTEDVTSAALDVSAALTARGELTLAVINADERDVTVKLALKGCSLDDFYRRYVISDRENDPLGFNDPGQPPRIAIQPSESRFNDVPSVTVPPMSVTLYTFYIK